MNDLLIVGRGPSILDFDDWDKFSDVMAVSSAIFAVPEHARPPKHFAAMDVPKWFLEGLHEEEVTHAWQNDGHIAPWPFWKYAEIAKHVPEHTNCHGGYRRLPDEVWNVVPQSAHAALGRSLSHSIHQFGFQPGWGDFSSVTGWGVDYAGHPNFTGAPIGMYMPDESQIRNTWFFAVQVAHRLGYRRLHFAGCDFEENRFALCEPRARHFWELAQKAGHEWVNLSPGTALDFLPTGAVGAGHT
jgi:hypothetical protein